MARPKSDIEPRIVHAARARFLTHGVDGASLRGIAKDAGTSIGMIYYYFPTKDELFMAVVEEIYHEFLGDLAEALDPSLTSEERVHRVSVRVSQMSDDEADVIRLVVREALTSSSRRDGLLERFSRGHLPLIAATIRDGIVRGELDSRHSPVVMTIVTFAVSALPHMLGRVAGAHPMFASAPHGEALATELVDLLMHGIAAPKR